ncbi:MAG: twin-arginine translocation signal domain-containing protein, partial [Kiritimatiellae bacterium]|nr:twin-arginine translocation signal domain-containing protein [Kiritimatiellia bacterium]
MRQIEFSRRRFLKGSAAAGALAFPTIIPARVLGQH